MVAISYRFVQENVNVSIPRYKTIPCYLALFALAEVFEILMAFDALRLRNVIQLFGILGFHSALIIFAALQIHETRSALLQPDLCGQNNNTYVTCDGSGTLLAKVQPFLIIAPCVIAFAWICLFFVIKKLYEEFGWDIFHVVGADTKTKAMYQYYQVIVCLLKFDFFVFAGVTMQMIILVLQKDTVEFGLTIAAVPIVLFLLIAAIIAVQREIKWLMGVSLVLMLAAQAYCIYKLVRFYEPDSSYLYLSTRATLTFFTVMTFLLLFATFAIGLRCLADFDKGLLESKLHRHGQSLYAPVNTTLKMDKIGDMNERQSSYLAGPRMSIE
ncbi:hypothetical protein JAAARDRAFT_31823 [Jaapia argillacea MUCL 33604]|uniref:TRP C-terminal domain-containing protein n=1 Tax=Jaapia argillacea MUCL 33604 TaxID=933084 RepID=A0A067Q1G7_9AGAM|nr:hypothetical protein JAAARDRAFT_31823 [Jaapia argillacea MUCL 33604]